MHVAFAVAVVGVLRQHGAELFELGEAILKAIDKYDGTVAVLASGSLSHRFIDDQRAEEGMNSYTCSCSSPLRRAGHR